MMIFIWSRRLTLVAAVAGLLILGSVPVCGQTLAHAGWAGSGMSADTWWKNAVFYQIDPLSFQDSNGDGFGDFNGIAMRLDYLQALGVDGIILSPLQPRADDKGQTGGAGKGAPLFDSTYGSEENFDNLVRQASERKIRVLVDLPLSGSQTMDSMSGIARFWLSRGVAGLRLVRDARDIDNGVAALTPYQIGDRVRELRRVTAGYAGQRVLLGDLGAETVATPVDGSTVPPGPAVAATGPARGGRGAGVSDGMANAQSPTQPHLEVDGHLAAIAKMQPAELKQALAFLTMPSRGTAAVAVVESDASGRQRSMDRYADGRNDLGIAEVLATVLLANRTAVMLYFGQEIGMVTTPPGATGGGDPVPMQWGVPGFTTGTPWLPMAANAGTVNVQAEEADARSLLRWYRQLSALHHGNPTIRDGSTAMLALTTPDVVAWVRRSARPEAAPVIVLCNVSNHPVRFSLTADLKAAQLRGYYFHTLLRSGMDALVAGPASLESMTLPAYGVYIGELHR